MHSRAPGMTPSASGIDEPDGNGSRLSLGER